MTNKVAQRDRSFSRIWSMLFMGCLLAVLVLLVIKISPRFRYVNLINAGSARERDNVENVLQVANIPWKLNGTLIRVPSRDKNKANILVAESKSANQGQIQVNAKH